MDLVSKNCKKCVLCKYWNGAIGSTTIQPKNMGNSFAFEHNEKQTCFKRCTVTFSWATCSYFESRYK